MRPAVRTEIRTGIAVVLILLATETNAAAAENAPLSIHSETEYSLLLEQLTRTMQEERTLLGAIRETAETASGPNTEYLLYQGSLRFAEQEARLAQLKMKTAETRRRLAPLQEKTDGSTYHLHGSTGDPAERGIPPYCGAPLLSFHHPTRFDPGALPFSSTGMIFFRLFFISALALALLFPLMAIEKGTVRLRRKGRTWTMKQFAQITKSLRGRPPAEIVRRATKKGAHGAAPKAA